MTTRPMTMMTALAAVVALAACGKSSADRAADDVCTARAHIQEQVTALRQLPPTSTSVDDVKTILKSIRDDFRTIVDAQPKLADERKEQVQAANEAFRAQVRAVAADVAQSRSAAGAPDQLRDAVAQLGQGYQRALSTGCG